MKTNNPSSQAPGSVSFPRGNHSQFCCGTFCGYFYTYLWSLFTLVPCFMHLLQGMRNLVYLHFHFPNQTSTLVLLEIIHLNSLLVLTFVQHQPPSAVRDEELGTLTLPFLPAFFFDYLQFYHYFTLSRIIMMTYLL